MTPYAGANRIRFYGTLSACTLCGQAPRSSVESSDVEREVESSGHDTGIARSDTSDSRLEDSGVIEFTLYVAGDTYRSQRAIANLRRMGDERLAGNYRLSVVDVAVDPASAERERILATPTLIKHAPPPMRRVMGDLVDFEQVMAALSLPSNGDSPHE